MAKIVNSNEFKNEIKDGVTLVDFFATWCGPCKMLGPVIEELSTDMEGKANVVKVDIDQSGDLAEEFKITNVPTMVIFKDGKEVEKLVGFSPKEKIKATIEAHL